MLITQRGVDAFIMHLREELSKRVDEIVQLRFVEATYDPTPLHVITLSPDSGESDILEVWFKLDDECFTAGGLCVEFHSDGTFIVDCEIGGDETLIWYTKELLNVLLFINDELQAFYNRYREEA